MMMQVNAEAAKHGPNTPSYRLWVQGTLVNFLHFFFFFGQSYSAFFYFGKPCQELLPLTTQLLGGRVSRAHKPYHCVKGESSGELQNRANAPLHQRELVEAVCAYDQDPS